MEENLLFALLLPLIAGLSTGIGSSIVLFSKRASKSFLSFALGLSAGVMIYVSFVDIFPKAAEALQQTHTAKEAQIFTVLAFFGGILLIALIDKLVPTMDNPHEPRLLDSAGGSPSSTQNLRRMGVLTAIAVAVHNFPEGIATFMAALDDPQIGVAIASAVAIHNIPEGIAVAIPIYYATGSRKKAFGWSFLSGLAEPVGAVVGYLALRPFLTPELYAIVFAAVAGIMVFISLDELLPAAREWGKAHTAIWGVIVGMAVMASGIILLA